MWNSMQVIPAMRDLLPVMHDVQCRETPRIPYPNGKMAAIPMRPQQQLTAEKCTGCKSFTRNGKITPKATRAHHITKKADGTKSTKINETTKTTTYCRKVHWV